MSEGYLGIVAGIASGYGWWWVTDHFIRIITTYNPTCHITYGDCTLGSYVYIGVLACFALLTAVIFIAGLFQILRGNRDRHHEPSRFF